MNTNEKIPRRTGIILFLLRLNIGVPLIIYGVAKLARIQFKIPDNILNLPMNEVDLFTLSWYLAGQEPFQSFMGCCEMAVGILIIISRHYLAASLVSLAIVINILIWDLSFMPYNLEVIGFVAELIFANVIIAVLHRDKISTALQNLKT